MANVVELQMLFDVILFCVTNSNNTNKWLGSRRCGAGKWYNNRYFWQLSEIFDSSLKVASQHNLWPWSNG